MTEKRLDVSSPSEEASQQPSADDCRPNFADTDVRRNALYGESSGESSRIRRRRGMTLSSNDHSEEAGVEALEVIVDEGRPANTGRFFQLAPTCSRSWTNCPRWRSRGVWRNGEPAPRLRVWSLRPALRRVDGCGSQSAP